MNIINQKQIIKHRKENLYKTDSRVLKTVAPEMGAANTSRMHKNVVVE